MEYLITKSGNGRRNYKIRKTNNTKIQEKITIADTAYSLWKK
jgi:hypothetical protein